MRSKRLVAAALIAALSCGSAISSMAAYWESVGTSDWKYVQDDGTYAAGKWIQHTDGNWYYLKADTMMAKGWVLDPADGHWYFTDSNGALVYGWIEVNGSAYYMNETHDGTFGALFVGTKDGYNCTENGTTNGKPTIGKKFNSDGTAIVNLTTTKYSSSSGGGSISGGGGGSVPPTIDAAVETMDDVKTNIEKALENNAVVKNVTVPAPDTNHKSAVTVELKDKVTDSNVVQVRDAANTAVATVLDSADEDKGVSVSVPGIDAKVTAKSYANVAEAQAAIEKLIGTWVTPANYDKYKDKTATVTVHMEGIPVTYTIGLK